MRFGFHETGKEWNDPAENAGVENVSQTAADLREIEEDFEDCVLEKVEEERGSHDEGLGEDMDRKADHSIVRLDENNTSISEVTGKQYGSVWRQRPTSVANSLNRVTESDRYTENVAVTVAVEKELCVKSEHPELAGGTGTREVVRIIDEVKGPDEDIITEVYEYGNAPKVEELAEKVSASDTVAIVGVDSAILWDERGDVSCSGLFQGSGCSDHWIMVDSPVYAAEGGVEGFRIADSGGGVDYVDKKKFEKMYLGDEKYKVEDPTVILVRNRKER